MSARTHAHLHSPARLCRYGPGWENLPLEPETAKLYDQAIKQLEALEAEVVEDPFAGACKHAVKLAATPGRSCAARGKGDWDKAIALLTCVLGRGGRSPAPRFCATLSLHFLLKRSAVSRCNPFTLILACI